MKFCGSIPALLLIFISATSVHAAEVLPAPAAVTPQTGSTANFDFFSDATASVAKSSPADERLVESAAKRRRMLKTHQALGLTTLGLMAATTIVGQLNYSDLYSPHHAGTGNYIWPHRLLAYSTALSFGAAGGFALLSPESTDEHPGFDTTDMHKIFVGGATLGMLTQIGLGFVTARYAESGNPKDLSRMARYHQISGYATTGLLSAAAITWVF
jgi:hypothetical protein